jgi:hypothetical protein
MRTSSSECDGIVGTLRGHAIAITGKIEIAGEHVTRDALAQSLQMYGACFKTDVTGQISLLVHGDLSSQPVKDPKWLLSKKLLNLAVEDLHGHHVCVISPDGLASLMDGGEAECYLDALVEQMRNR